MPINLMDEKKEIQRLALERYGKYWNTRKKQLSQYIDALISEINALEEVSSSGIKEDRRVKLLWILSGVGTFLKPITNNLGDKIYKELKWAHWCDKRRIQRALYIARRINPDLEDGGPIIIYNGVEEQNEDLASAVQAGQVDYNDDLIHILKGGGITKTLDQVRSFKLPDNVDWREGDKIGIISHAPHLVRVMRMINSYNFLPKDVGVKLFPIVFHGEQEEREFAKGEIMGILGYTSRGEISLDPYPYEI